MSGSNGQQTVTGGVGGFITYTESFDVTGLTVAANYLDIEIEATDALTEVIEFVFDSITMVQVSALIPSDFLHSASRDSGSQTVTKDIILYIADRQESDNDICSIKDSGGTLTSSWDRFGKTDTSTLIQLFQLNVINDNATHISYIKTTVNDPNETAEVHDLVFNRDATYARIVAISKNYGSAAVDYDVIELEILALVSDVTFNTVTHRLNTNYGESQD